MLADLTVFCFGSWPKLSVLMACSKIELLQIGETHAFLDYFYLIWRLCFASDLHTNVERKILFLDPNIMKTCSIWIKDRGIVLFMNCGQINKISLEMRLCGHVG